MILFVDAATMRFIYSEEEVRYWDKRPLLDFVAVARATAVTEAHATDILCFMTAEVRNKGVRNIKSVFSIFHFPWD